MLAGTVRPNRSRPLHQREENSARRPGPGAFSFWQRMMMKFTRSKLRKPKFLRAFVTLLVFCILRSSFCFSQEPPRASLAGPQTAAARRAEALTLDRPSFKLGPATWSLGAGLGLQASDNIQLQSTDPVSDFAFHPEIHTRMLCPVSDKNVLNVVFRTGYSAYVVHPELNRFYIGPESKLHFEIYAGDFRIDLHDRCSLLENNYEDPTVVGSGDYTRLENTVGTGMLWDLNKALFSLSYDHINYISYCGDSATTAAFPDAQSDVLFSSAGYWLKPGLLAGLEFGGTLFQYAASRSPHLFDALQWTIGPFVDVRLSEYLACRAGAGYSAYTPQGVGASPTAEDNYGLYANIALTHQLNKFVNYTLSGGKSITFALYGGTVDLSYARLRTNWLLVRKCGIAISLAYEHGTDVVAGGESFNRFGPALSLERSLTESLTASLEYQFYQRDSNLPDHRYTTNIVMARLIYEF